MEIIKQNNSLILKLKNGKKIEEYSFNEEVNFKKLLDFLLSQSLDEEYSSVSDEIEDIFDNEKTLIKLINDILTDYNVKVQDFKEFKENKAIEDLENSI